MLQKKRKKKTVFNMRYSHAVNHPSTILYRQVLTSGKNGQPSTTINHIQFFTKQCNRLTYKLLSKHCKVNLDLDDLRKARNAGMTQRATERVPEFSLCCDRRQEAFATLGFLLLIVPKFVSCYASFR